MIQLKHIFWIFINNFFEAADFFTDLSYLLAIPSLHNSPVNLEASHKAAYIICISEPLLITGRRG